MKGALLLIAGIVIGAVATGCLTRSERGREVLDGVEDRVRGFGAAVGDGYRAREAELRDTVA